MPAVCIHHLRLLLIESHEDMDSKACFIKLESSTLSCTAVIDRGVLINDTAVVSVMLGGESSTTQDEESDDVAFTVCRATKLWQTLPSTQINTCMSSQSAACDFPPMQMHSGCVPSL
jgi:hypothetical protein